jgi:hypothetical protein
VSESNELASLTANLDHLLDRVCGAVEGLNEAQLNWRPPAPETNSIYVLAMHILGNAEAWVLGIAYEHPVERDRPAEFRSAGPDASAIVTRANDLRQRFATALEAMSSANLDVAREPASPSLSSLWTSAAPQPVTARDAIIQVIRHGSEHLGHIGVTRDWMRDTQG